MLMAFVYFIDFYHIWMLDLMHYIQFIYKPIYYLKKKYNDFLTIASYGSLAVLKDDLSNTFTAKSALSEFLEQSTTFAKLPFPITFLKV